MILQPHLADIDAVLESVIARLEPKHQDFLKKQLRPTARTQQSEFTQKMLRAKYNLSKDQYYTCLAQACEALKAGLSKVGVHSMDDFV